jgi:hypothetical protein
MVAGFLKICHSICAFLFLVRQPCGILSNEEY